MSVDEQFSLALFIRGPGEPQWLKGFGLSGTQMDNVFSVGPWLEISDLVFAIFCIYGLHRSQ